MSVMRHVVIAAVVAACLPAALAISSCPTATDQAKRLYANASLMCASGLACHSAYCSCIGAATASNLTCTTPTTAPNCSTAQMCVGAFIKCTNNASDSGCPGLRELHMSLLNVQSGSRWNTSTAWSGCAYRACKLVNSSTGGANCTVDLATACPSPVEFTAQLTISGNFSWMVGNAAALATFSAGVVADLKRELRVLLVLIRRMLINGNVVRRQNGNDTLLVDFAVPGVNSRNTEFAQLFTQLQSAGSSVLTSAQAAFLAAGGTGTLTLVGVTATGSSAGSASGSTPAGSGTTATPGSGSATTAPGSNPTNGSNPTGSTGSSGASAHSFVVAVVLAAVSALLF